MDSTISQYHPSSLRLWNHERGSHTSNHTYDFVFCVVGLFFADDIRGEIRGRRYVGQGVLREAVGCDMATLHGMHHTRYHHEFGGWEPDYF